MRHLEVLRPPKFWRQTVVNIFYHTSAGDFAGVGQTLKISG